MIKQDKEGKYYLTDSLITSGYETQSTAINNYVLSGISMAKDALDLVSGEKETGLLKRLLKRITK